MGNIASSFQINELNFRIRICRRHHETGTSKISFQTEILRFDSQPVWVASLDIMTVVKVGDAGAIVRLASCINNGEKPKNTKNKIGLTLKNKLCHCKLSTKLAV